MSQETITITTKEYERLKKDARILEALYANGVDNWEWFGDAMESIEDEEE